MIVTRTPMRITLGGGGTDLPSYYSRFGCTMVSAAIDKYMFITVNRRVCDDLLMIKYSRVEIVDGVSKIIHPLVREALVRVGIDKAVGITSMADAPAGTGLGSSSVFLIGLLNALHALKGEQIPRHELAEEACRIEIDILKKPIGKQDQYIAAFGGITILEIDRNGEVSVRPARISYEAIREFEHSILIFYTGIKREELDILQEQDSATKKEDNKTLDNLHRIRDLGLRSIEALENENLRLFGELLEVHWKTKRRQSSGISNRRIDRWYEIAKKNGAVGGKIMGAGGGGFFMFYCDRNRSKLRKALQGAGLREIPYKFDMEGTKVLVNF